MYQLLPCAEQPEHAALLAQSIDEFATAAKAILSGLGLIEKAAPLYALQRELATDPASNASAIDKAGAALSAARRAKIQGVIDLLQQLVDEAMPPTSTQKGAHMAHTVEELTAQVATLTKRAETAEAQVTQLTADLAKAQQTPEQQEAAYLASLPESVRKRYEAEQVEKAALREELRVEKDASAKQDYIQKARSFQHLPLNADEDWTIFKALAGVEAPVAERITQLLKAADEGMRTAQVFGERGVSGTGPTGATAAAKADALAKAKQKDQPTLVYTEALNQVWKENDGLYAQYNAEMRSHRA
jgi:hypothetical protein